MSFWREFQFYPRVVPQPVRPPEAPVWVIAHRGASREAPENTLAAFALAINQGADMLELDLRLSRDQELMVFHDRSLKRTTGQDGLLQHYTRAELKQCDAGSWFSPQFAGEEIPTLAEVLELARGQVMLNLEIKADALFRSEALLEKKLIRLLHDYDLCERVLISSFAPLALSRIKALAPNLSTALLYGSSIRSTLRSRLPVYHLQAFRQVLEIQADALNLRYPLVTAATVRRSRETRINLYPYTIDSPKIQKRLIKWGVQGIITNQPARLRHLLRRQL